MKTARRHELQTNQLANWLGEKIIVIQHYSTAIVVTLLAVLDTLHQGFNDPKYRPAPLLREMVDAGRLGRKSGRGFYEY